MGTPATVKVLVALLVEIYSVLKALRCRLAPILTEDLFTVGPKQKGVVANIDFSGRR